MFGSDAIFEIPVGFIAICLLSVFHVLQWYMVERIATLPLKEQEKPYEYIPECSESVAEVNEEFSLNFDRYNVDGSLNLDYYSGEPVQSELEEQTAPKPQHREISSIEGTETEDLWNELQKVVSKVAVTESNSEPSLEKQVEQLQERINELSELEVQNGEDHLEEIILCLHKKMELQGNQEQCEEIEKQYPEFFNRASVSEATTDIEERNVVTFEHQSHTIKGTDLPDIFEEYATHIVADNYIGKQTWYGKVLEKNESSYILFTDGSKEVWIHAGDKANRLNIGELVLIDVVREYDHISLKKAVKLKQQVKQDQIKQAL